MAVYLIHFNKKLRHAQHYLGFADDVDKRIARHRSGRGARLLRALNDLGIEWECVRRWDDGDRAFERKLKGLKNAKRLCPVCLAAKSK